MKADYIIRQGEEISLSLIATAGSIDDISSVEAVLKAAGPNGSVPRISAPVLATFSVNPTAQVGSIGWDFVLSGTDTLALDPGFYVTNAKLNLTGNGGPLKTDPVIIEIRGSVT